MRKLAWPTPALAILLFLEAAPAFAGTILFFGDSLTAGLGVEESQAFPALIAEKIREKNLPFEVVNAGVSGDTSAGGLSRLDWVLQKPIDIFVLELGANDGLRGLPLSATKENLQKILDRVRRKDPQVKIVVAGMQIPPNFGAEYAADFRAMFEQLARANQVALIPFLLEGVGGHVDLNQADRIHPTVAGHKVVAENVWRILEPLLSRNGS
jgi:acyl-CoA thioesterase-1